MFCLNENYYLFKLIFSFSFPWASTLAFFGGCSFSDFTPTDHHSKQHILLYFMLFLLFLFSDLLFNCFNCSLLPYQISWSPSTPEISPLRVLDENEHFLLTPSLCHLLSYTLRLCFSTSLALNMLLEGLPKMILSKAINFVYRIILLPHPFFNHNWLFITITSFPAFPQHLSRHMEGFTTSTSPVKQVFSNILSRYL